MIIDPLSLHAEYFGEDAVKRSHVEIGSFLCTHQPGYPLLHFLCSLIGKSKGKDVPRLILFFINEIGHFIGQHPGFARTRTGNDQRCAVAVFHGLSLAFIQLTEEVIIHRYVRYFFVLW